MERQKTDRNFVHEANKNRLCQRLAEVGDNDASSLRHYLIEKLVRNAVEDL